MCRLYVGVDSMKTESVFLEVCPSALRGRGLNAAEHHLGLLKVPAALRAWRCNVSRARYIFNNVAEPMRVEQVRQIFLI